MLGRSGEKIGEVSDLLFDAQAQKVRYLIIELQADADHETNDEDKRILIPIGVANLSNEQETLTIPVNSAEELAGLPAYETGALSPEDEVQIREVFGGSIAPYEHPQFYAHEHFNVDKFYNRQSALDNNTIVSAENVDDDASAARAERASEIVDKLNQSDEEPRSTEFPQGKIVGEFESAGTNRVTTESLERENSQPVEETGNNDYALNEGFTPEPESVEQEAEWQQTQHDAKGNSKLLEFFVDELKDLLWAERELVDTLPDMAEAATSQELKNAFIAHLEQTETHVVRLEQIFGMLGLEPETTTCDAMSGIIDEGDGIISDTDDGTAQRDVGLIFAGQKAEHYEIASYGGMISLAKTLGFNEIAELLVMTIDEEKTADAMLTHIAENHVNYEASKEPSED